MAENKSSSSPSRRLTLSYIQSNNFEPKDIQVWVNPINCVGIMGAGLAEIFGDKFPDMYEDYKQRCTNKKVIMGQPYLYTATTPWILNFPTKNHYRDQSKLPDIEKGLKYLIVHAKEWGIESIAFPALGCGHGRLEWKKVYPLMRKYLQRLDGIRVEIHARDPEPQVAKTPLISEFFSPSQEDAPLQQKRAASTTAEKPSNKKNRTTSDEPIIVDESVTVTKTF